MESLERFTHPVLFYFVHSGQLKEFNVNQYHFELGSDVRAYSYNQYPIDCMMTQQKSYHILKASAKNTK